MKKIKSLFKGKHPWLIIAMLMIVGFFLTKYIQSNKYLAINSLLDVEKQINIPKLEDDWIPQGIAKTEDFLFVSVYDPEMEEGESGEGGRPSVIFVIDNHTDEHLKTLSFEGEVDGEVIDLRSHFGAIDYVEEKNILYIADSTNGIVWQVQKADIDSALEEAGEGAKVNAEQALVEREVTPSFLTYHNGLLYIGQHDEDSEAENYMIGYDLNTNEAKTDKIPLHLKSQGITFIDYEDQLYLLTSSSRGVDNPSLLIVEKVNETTDEKGTIVLEKNVVKELALPNMSEDLFGEEGSVYISFESAAKYYNEEWRSLFTEKRHILVMTMEAILK